MRSNIVLYKLIIFDSMKILLLTFFIFSFATRELELLEEEEVEIEPKLSFIQPELWLIFHKNRQIFDRQFREVYAPRLIEEIASFETIYPLGVFKLVDIFLTERLEKDFLSDPKHIEKRAAMTKAILAKSPEAIQQLKDFKMEHF